MSLDLLIEIALNLFIRIKRVDENLMNDHEPLTSFLSP